MYCILFTYHLCSYRLPCHMALIKSDILASLYLCTAHKMYFSSLKKVILYQVFIVYLLSQQGIVSIWVSHSSNILCLTKYVLRCQKTAQNKKNLVISLSKLCTKEMRQKQSFLGFRHVHSVILVGKFWNKK